MLNIWWQIVFIHFWLKNASVIAFPAILINKLYHNAH